MVREPTREKGADEAADQQRADGEAKRAFAEVEGGPETVLCPVDGAAVIAEQETADGRHCNDGADEPHVCPGATRLDHSPSPRIPSTVSANGKLQACR